MTERWIPTHVPGYDVSSEGRVRSRRGVLTGSGVKYRTIYLAGRTVYVHHLVAAAFLGPRPAGMHIRHLDGNSLNNKAENLAYGTRSENSYDAVRHGTNPRTAQTSCVNGHEFTPDNTQIDNRGYRVCRACQRDRYRNRKARNV